MDDFNFNDEFEPEQPPAPQTANVPAQEQNGGGRSAEKGGGNNAAKQQKKRNALIAAGALVLAALFFVIGWLAHFYSIDARARKLLWLIDTVDDNYYKEITDEEWDKVYADLYDSVLPDRFCSYFTAEEYAALVRESEGSNADTGLAPIDDGDLLRVYRVVGNSPAAHVGIREGMIIYRFGGSEESLKSGNRADLFALSGTTGGKLFVECGFSEESKKIYTVQSGEYLASYCSYRDSGTSYDFLGEKELVLTDTKKPLSGVDGKTAYIRLTQFDGNADEEFKELLMLMKERGRENLIIDLRSNGGGYLNTFQSIASHLLRNARGASPLVATAKYRSGKVTKFRADGNDFELYFSATSRVSILADENTASASECLIGALVDYGTVNYSDIYLRKTEGETAHSFGKGVMQSAYVAADQSMARITSAQIFWPVSGKSIHDVAGDGSGGVRESEGGAIGIVAPLLPYETDTMLAQVVARLA